MKLITMAHFGEAQSLIETFGMKESRPQLYQSEKFFLLITGEGPVEALAKTALTIPTLNISEVVNIGIAGSLTDELKIGSIVPVRTVYLVQDLKPQFKTFQSFEVGHDCITSFERILDPLKAQKLKGIGHLIDREAWGVAMASKSAGIPFRSIKVISDRAGTLDACELVREKAQELSQLMVTIFEEKLNHPRHSSGGHDLPGFHFTFTSRHRLMNLLRKLSIKKNLQEEELLKILPLEELRALEVSPKEKARLLLDELDNQLDPVKKVIQAKLDTLAKDFQQKGFRLQSDPQLERPKLTISFEAANNDDLQDKARALQTLSLEVFSSMMNGALNVE